MRASGQTTGETAKTVSLYTLMAQVIRVTSRTTVKKAKATTGGPKVMSTQDFLKITRWRARVNSDIPLALLSKVNSNATTT